MKRRTKLLVAAAAVAGISAGAAGIAVATGVGDGDEAPITGDALDRASAVALEATGGGRVTETEVGDEESYYEVEVTLEDGRRVDVHLDEDFDVVGQQHDSDSEDDGNDRD